MHVLETRIQQLVKVALQEAQINDLVAALPELGRTLALNVGVKLLDCLQDQLWLRIRRGEAELACTRCGVVHCGESAARNRLSRSKARRRLKNLLRKRGICMNPAGGTGGTAARSPLFPLFFPV